jgi:hypothetical protein
MILTSPTPVLYSAELLRAHPNVLFVFGDNGDRKGYGGQACIRDEPNTVGIATLPHLGVFAQDGDSIMMRLMAQDLTLIRLYSLSNRPVFFPTTPTGDLDIGTGIADLPNKAPLLFAQLQCWFKNLCATQSKGEFHV